MCHNSAVQNAQIDRFVEHGMPHKIIKSVQYTIRKRSEQHKKDPNLKTTEEVGNFGSTSRIMTATLASSTTPRGAVNKLRMNLSGQQSDVSHDEPQLTCPFGRSLGLQKENIPDTVTDVHGAQEQKEWLAPADHEIYTDILATLTQWTRRTIERVNNAMGDVQNSRIYILLTKTTQPAHVIAICILSFILLTVWPEIIESTSVAQQTSTTEISGTRHLAVIAYLGAFATHFGAQIWMTFVSGLSLYFALPRHTFGQCQQILFPKYFALNSVLSISMLILFIKFFLINWTFCDCVQLGGLALMAIIDVTVRLYLAPPMLLLMREKYKIEEAVGSGQEVGGVMQGDLVKCPHYQRIHRMFRRIHMTVAIGNIMTLLCTCLHLHYLASKLSFT